MRRPTSRTRSVKTVPTPPSSLWAAPSRKIRLGTGGKKKHPPWQFRADLAPKQRTTSLDGKIDKKFFFSLFGKYAFALFFCSGCVQGSECRLPKHPLPSSEDMEENASEAARHRTVGSSRGESEAPRKDAFSALKERRKRRSARRF